MVVVVTFLLQLANPRRLNITILSALLENFTTGSATLTQAGSTIFGIQTDLKIIIVSTYLHLIT